MILNCEVRIEDEFITSLQDMFLTTQIMKMHVAIVSDWFTMAQMTVATDAMNEFMVEDLVCGRFLAEKDSFDSIKDRYGLNESDFMVALNLKQSWLYGSIEMINIIIENYKPENSFLELI